MDENVLFIFNGVNKKFSSISSVKYVKYKKNIIEYSVNDISYYLIDKNYCIVEISSNITLFEKCLKDINKYKYVYLTTENNIYELIKCYNFVDKKNAIMITIFDSWNRKRKLQNGKILYEYIYNKQWQLINSIYKNKLINYNYLYNKIYVIKKIANLAGWKRWDKELNSSNYKCFIFG